MAGRIPPFLYLYNYWFKEQSRPCQPHYDADARLMVLAHPCAWRGWKTKTKGHQPRICPIWVSPSSSNTNKSRRKREFRIYILHPQLSSTNIPSVSFVKVYHLYIIFRITWEFDNTHPAWRIKARIDTAKYKPHGYTRGDIFYRRSVIYVFRPWGKVWTLPRSHTRR